MASLLKSKPIQDHEGFHMFCNRVRHTVSHSVGTETSLTLIEKQLEYLYQEVQQVVETSLFAEMQAIMSTIQTSMNVVKMYRCPSVPIKEYMRNDQHFKEIVTYIVTRYQSLQERRVHILMIHHPSYQQLQDKWFGGTQLSDYSFDEVYQQHQDLKRKICYQYHDLLFHGVVLDTDDKLKTKVIEAVIQ